MYSGNVPNYIRPQNRMNAGGPGGDPSGYNVSTGTGAGVGTGDGSWGSIVTGLGGAAADIYGSRNASEAQNTGNQNAINTYLPQQQIGMGAMNTLADTLGTSGRPANYNNFLNMPGYQFAVGQGTRAINNQASAMGNLYTPNTLDAVGSYVAGTAMSDYNTYVNQLLSTAQFGQNANANIAQGQINKGTAQAGGYAGTAGAIGSFLNGPNASGLINKGASAIGKWWGGGGANTPNGTGNPADTSGDNSGNYWDSGGPPSTDQGNYWDSGGPGPSSTDQGNYWDSGGPGPG